jgi:hypothetical protein
MYRILDHNIARSCSAAPPRCLHSLHKQMHGLHAEATVATGQKMPQEEEQEQEEEEERRSRTRRVRSVIKARQARSVILAAAPPAPRASANTSRPRAPFYREQILHSTTALQKNTCSMGGENTFHRIARENTFYLFPPRNPDLPASPECECPVSSTWTCNIRIKSRTCTKSRALRHVKQNK